MSLWSPRRLLAAIEHVLACRAAGVPISSLTELPRTGAAHLSIPHTLRPTRGSLPRRLPVVDGDSRTHGGTVPPRGPPQPTEVRDDFDE